MDLHREIEVDASAEAAWEVLGTGFGSIGTWATAILESSLDRPLGPGAVRTCAIRGFGPIAKRELHEELVHFDPEAMEFTYRVIRGLPSMIVSATNRWRVVPDGPDRCRVTTHATLVPVWWMHPLSWLLRWRLQGDVGTFAEELRHRILRGVPHPRKLAS